MEDSPVAKPDLEDGTVYHQNRPTEMAAQCDAEVMLATVGSNLL